jgi:hypothetical protein
MWRRGSGLIILNIFLVASARLGDAVEDDGEKSGGAGVSPLTASVGRRGRSPCFRTDGSWAMPCHNRTQDLLVE